MSQMSRVCGYWNFGWKWKCPKKVVSTRENSQLFSFPPLINLIWPHVESEVWQAFTGQSVRSHAQHMRPCFQELSLWTPYGYLRSAAQMWDVSSMQTASCLMDVSTLHQWVKVDSIWVMVCFGRRLGMQISQVLRQAHAATFPRQGSVKSVQLLWSSAPQMWDGSSMQTASCLMDVSNFSHWVKVDQFDYKFVLVGV